MGANVDMSQHPLQCDMAIGLAPGWWRWAGVYSLLHLWLAEDPIPGDCGANKEGAEVSKGMHGAENFF